MHIHKAKKMVAKRYFDRWAHTYDESILQHIVFRSSHKMLFNEINGSTSSPYNGSTSLTINPERSRTINNNHNGKSLKMLDVGCGTGELTFKLANHYQDRAQIHGVDISSIMIKRANSKKNGHNIKFKVGDVEDLPYEDNTFDVITCSHSFHHYPNKEKAISEMFRVLKPNGRVMIIDGCRDVLFGRIIFDIIGRIEKHVYHLFDREFRELFRKIGFNNIVQKRFNFVPLLLTMGTAIKNTAKTQKKLKRRKNEFVF